MYSFYAIVEAATWEEAWNQARVQVKEQIAREMEEDPLFAEGYEFYREQMLEQTRNLREQRDRYRTAKSAKSARTGDLS
jgi:hypothetical protein